METILLLILYVVLAVSACLSVQYGFRATEKMARAQCMADWCDYGTTLKTSAEVDVILQGIKSVDKAEELRKSAGHSKNPT